MPNKNDYGRKVKVYYNLHKKLFSVVALEGDMKGKVIEHTDKIDLAKPIFRVQRAGREKVLREKRKNVHAYVAGYRCELKSDKELERNGAFKWVIATYDPYKYDSFVSVKDKIKVSHCRYASLSLEKGLRVSDDYIYHKDHNYKFGRN